MNFDAIRIVLVETSHPGNIGGSARAMKTMGITQLYLVNPKSFPHPAAIELSAGADDVLNQAVVVDSLDEALRGCQLILGTSARPRGIALSGLTPRECGEHIAGLPDDTKVALIFGREYAGLTNEELLKCHYHIHIASNPDYSSLNLSQAVQILCYEARQAILNPKAMVTYQEDPLASSEAIHLFYDHLREVLIDIGFLKLTSPRRLLERLRRLFNRVKLEEMEVNLLRGILTQVQKTIKKSTV